jgi:two-component sensor histidine kinase
MPPYFEFAFETTGQKIDVLIYFIASLFVVWGAEHYRGLIKRLQDEENLRKLAVEELAHRLKNKIATIQSVLSYQLREHPRLRDDIIARLIALSATDDLIMATQGRGASIRDILSTELGAYEMSRIAMEGPDVFLSPKLAMTMALLVHELATNAAKYGSLSNPVGKLSIYWSLSAATLSLEWRESGGPIVASPTNRGFGLRLLSRALDQFGGAVEMAFDRTGLICKMKARYPESSPSIVPEPSRIGA